MTFGDFNDGIGTGDPTESRPMSDINVTPMVDVMLVLLVIFIITAPLFTHAIKLELPKVKAAAVQEKPETITLSINAQGQFFWNNQPISSDALHAQLAAVASQKNQPEIHLRADKATRYDAIAQVMSAAQSHGLKKIGFVTQPTDQSKK